MTERDAYIAFNVFSGIGPQRFKLLIDYFGTALSAYRASKDILHEVGLGEQLLQKFVDFRSDFDNQVYETELLQKEIRIVTRIDSSFPPLLKEIPDPPIALFIKGTFDGNSSGIGVVGTRKPTTYGKDITAKITESLVHSGLSIISGMARGVDAIAHQTTLRFGGKTIAVLGCGVDIVYPPEHKELYAQILSSGGAIISEVAPGHTVLKGLFPARNRIISGLSIGILVTEGAEDSGSLITARYAAEQGRDVFAVPGPITSYLSLGPSKLIKQGAKLVTNANDILEELGIDARLPKHIPKSNETFQKNGIAKTLSHDEQQIVGLLQQNTELHYDELIRESGLDSSHLGTVVTQLELAGIIRALGNGKYGLIFQ